MRDVTTCGSPVSRKSCSHPSSLPLPFCLPSFCGRCTPESPHKMDHSRRNELQGTSPWATLRRHRSDPRNQDASTRDLPPPLTSGCHRGSNLTTPRNPLPSAHMWDVPHWGEAMRAMCFPHGLGAARRTPSCRRKSACRVTGASRSTIMTRIWIGDVVGFLETSGRIMATKPRRSLSRLLRGVYSPELPRLRRRT